MIAHSYCTGHRGHRMRYVEAFNLMWSDGPQGYVDRSWEDQGKGA